MPTHNDYEAAAETFRLRARGYADSVAWAPRAVAGSFTGPGPVADAVDAGFGAALNELDRAAAALAAVAAECERRAAICRSYGRAIAAWRSLPPEVRQATARPARPAHWVDL